MKDSRQAIKAMLSGEPIRPVAAPLWDGIFAAPIVGKEYASEVTTDELMEVAEICGFDPILRMDATALWPSVETLQMDTRIEQAEGLRRTYTTFACPAGQITMTVEEPKQTSGTCIKDGCDSPQIYDVIEWYFHEILAHREGMAEEAKKFTAKYGERAALEVGWLTPVELYFMAYPNIITQYLDHRDRHREVMELHLEVIEAMVQACAAADFDALYLSGPPIELIGHNLYDEMGLSYLIRSRQIAHQAGLWFHFHNCGHIKRMLKEGTYNHLLPDLFETLAPPTMGELEDLRWAREQLDKRICTRGNMDLEFLKTSTPQQVAQQAAEILKETEGYRHIVATADEMLTGTPTENVRAMVQGTLSYT